MPVDESDSFLRAIRKAQLEDLRFLAAEQVESAALKRDSVSRKLCAGSSHVTLQTLDLLEKDLAAAQDVYSKVSRHLPVNA